MKPNKIHLFLLAVMFPLPSGLAATSIQEPTHLWHPAVLTFDGPSADESESTFRNYRLDVTFAKGAKSYTVPGYFAADGNASESSASSGNKWRVKFTPDEPGTWTYRVSFRSGKDIAIDPSISAGNAVTELDGETGSFQVGAYNPSAPGFFAKGQLRYVGEHHGQFVGNKEWHVKAGPGSPEDFFGYGEFDNTADTGKRKEGSTQVKDVSLREENGDGVHLYKPHVKDWKAGDPIWKGDQGKGIVGALNYLSSIGVNSIYMIPLTVNDDADNTWPWVARDKRMQYDVSKLDQWDIVFSHMDQVGISPNYYICENMNSMLMMEGKSEAQRVMGIDYKIYLREIIARFGYHLGMRFNLGEETRANAEQQIQVSKWISDLDPYGLIVGGHSYAKMADQHETFPLLLGVKTYDGPQYQLHEADKRDHTDIVLWRDRSAAAGHKWIVANDEAWPVLPETEAEAKDARKYRERIERYTWNTFMAGGEGLFQYVGYDVPSFNDITIEDFRRMEISLNYLTHAKQLFSLPRINALLPEMRTDNALVENEGGNRAPYCYAKPGDAYIIYRMEKEGQKTLDLTGVSGGFDVRWFSPRAGGSLQTGSIPTVQGGGRVDLGIAPSENDKSWAIIVTRVGNSLPMVSVVATDPSAAESLASQSKNEGLFTFSRTGDLTAPLTINFATQGAAESDVDYENLGDSITIPIGKSSVTRSLAVDDDTLEEGGETAILTLKSDPGYNIGPQGRAEIAIADNDGKVAPPTIAVEATDATASESGDEGIFTFTRSSNFNGPLKVDFAISGSAKSGADYPALGTSVEFGDGQKTVLKRIAALDDKDPESKESISVKLENSKIYSVGSPNSATVEIADNDRNTKSAEISVVASDSKASKKGDNGTFTFRRSGSLTGPLAVKFTLGGTAEMGSDYDSFGNTITFADGKEQVDLEVFIIKNQSADDPETVVLTLQGDDTYTMGSSKEATIQIND
jgi:Domain of unknown function (DUF5060)/Calx-beta domain